ncbi:hypothetical protein KSS87_007310 [Heliosperma pusillum]|nr:hypothetical protein KSS87_014782 [Heliosperma pusillum]KAH9623489.1 hypothetical protein KSS87_007310 [Heliosperma pusillum]
MMIKHQDNQDFVEENMSNLTSPVSGEASVSSSSNRGEPSNSIIYPHQQQYFSQQQQELSLQEHSEQPPAKKKRNQPGNPDPESEVIALSPTTLLAKNRFVCEICNKGFQRDQNLQLHRRGHNLPWKLKQRSKTEVIRKKVYVCPETTCVHHDPSRALGDLTGIKKHFCRKHGEKKWKCDKCSKKYAVQSDWKAHSKVCGTREYRCDCGTLFSRRDSFITHRAFCDALAEETARAITTTHPLITNTISAVPSNLNFMHMQQQQQQQQQHAVVQLMNINPIHASSSPLKIEQHPHHQNFINLPPWLASSPMDLHHHNHLTSSSSSSIFHHHEQDQQQQQQQEQQHQYDDEQSQNPRNPSMGMRVGPTFTTSYQTQVASLSSSAHMSATALLQQAAQMGATISSHRRNNNNAAAQTLHSQGHVTDNNSHNTTTTATTSTTAGLFGLNLSSSRDIHHQQDTMSSSTITTTCGPGHGPGPSSSSVFLHDMMVNSLSSSSYDDAFGMGDMGMLSSTNSINKRDHSTMAFGGGGGRGVEGKGSGGGNEGLTRDFLGLRPLSQNEILTIAELSNCMASNSNNNNTTSTTHQQQENHKPWEN